MSDEKPTVKTIKDVMFFYSSTTYANKQLNKEGKEPLSTDPLEGHSYEIKILITEERFKALKRAFSGAKNFPNARDYTPEDCVKKLGMKEEPEDDMVLVKFAQSAMMGKPGDRRRSRAIDKIGIVNGIRDRNGLDILPETNMGNGTKGHLQFKPVETKYGLYLYPVAVCITELVEYHGKNGDGGGNNRTDYDAFGVEGDLVEQSTGSTKTTPVVNVVDGTSASEEAFDAPF